MKLLCLSLLVLTVRAVHELRFPDDDPAAEFYYTLKVSGCQCEFDEERWDCACCRHGGDQCPDLTFPHKCVAPGRRQSDCSSAVACSARADDVCFQLADDKRSHEAAWDACERRPGGFLAELSWSLLWDNVNAHARQAGLESFWTSDYVDSAAWSWTHDQVPLYYQGCYHDSSVDPELPYDLGAAYDTPFHCVQECKARNYPFASIQMVQDPDSTYGKSPKCRCGQSLGVHDPAPEGECRTPCPGSAGGGSADLADGPPPMCGGIDRQRLFHTHGETGPGGFSAWGAQPQDTIVPGYCGAQRRQGWYKEDCQQRKAYVCHYEDKSYMDCSAHFGLVWVGDWCLKLLPGPLSWHEARDDCAQNQGFLVTGLDKEVSKFLAKEYGGAFPDGWWIGLTSRQWGWSEHSHWADGQPDPSDLDHCVLARRDKDYAWATAPCEERHHYYCAVSE